MAGDLDRARSVVAAAAVELVTNRWSDDMRVTLVGFGSALAPISEHRLRCVDSLDEVVEGVTDRLSAGRQELSASGIDSVLTGRVRGLRGDGLTPDFLVLATRPRRSSWPSCRTGPARPGGRRWASSSPARCRPRGGGSRSTTAGCSTPACSA